MSFHYPEKAASRGEPSYVWRSGQERRLGMLREWGDLSGRILDNGCGLGTYLEAMASVSKERVGLEIEFERAATALLHADLVVQAVGEELPFAGLDADKVLTGSTEDNVPTVQTGIGVVVIGFVSATDFKPGSSQNGDIVVCIGKPKSAPDDEVDLDDPEISDTVCIRTLAELDYIHDILPVGSSLRKPFLSGFCKLLSLRR